MTEDSPYPASEAYENKSLNEIAQSSRIRNPPVRVIVTQQIADLKKEIKAREDLLAALDAQPGVEDVLDKMRKLHI